MARAPEQVTQPFLSATGPATPAASPRSCTPFPAAGALHPAAWRGGRGDVRGSVILTRTLVTVLSPLDVLIQETVAELVLFLK